MAFLVLETFWTLPTCEYTPSIVSSYLVVLYFTHYAIVGIIFFIGLLRKELYLLLLSFGITANYWLNYLLLWAFSHPIPNADCGGTRAFFCINAASPYNACGTPLLANPVGATCGLPPLPLCDPCVACGMPALEPQLTTFTVLSIGLFALSWRAPHVHAYQIALLHVLYSLVMYAHVYIGFNSVAQVLAGSLVGTVTALVFHCALFALVYPRFDAMLAWPLARRFGYRDTYCRTYETPVPGDPVLQQE